MDQGDPLFGANRFSRAVAALWLACRSCPGRHAFRSAPTFDGVGGHQYESALPSLKQALVVRPTYPHPVCRRENYDGFLMLILYWPPAYTAAPRATSTSPTFHVTHNIPRLRRRANAHTDFHRHRSWIVGFCRRLKYRGECGVDSEKELVDAFERVIHKDIPNPQRINCPGHHSLLRLATYADDAQSGSVLAHVRQLKLS
jgi:hypothetical protein